MKTYLSAACWPGAEPLFFLEALHGPGSVSFADSSSSTLRVAYPCHATESTNSIFDFPLYLSRLWPLDSTPEVSHLNYQHSPNQGFYRYHAESPEITFL